MKLISILESDENLGEVGKIMIENPKVNWRIEAPLLFRRQTSPKNGNYIKFPLSIMTNMGIIEEY